MHFSFTEVRSCIISENHAGAGGPSFADHFGNGGSGGDGGGIFGISGALMTCTISSNGTGNGGGGKSGKKKPRITKVKLTPKKGWVYRDGYVKMKVAVTNKGKGSARDVWVHLFTSKKGVSVTPFVHFKKIKPRKTATRSIKVEARRNVKGKVRVKAKVWGKKTRSTLKLIRPWW